MIVWKMRYLFNLIKNYININANNLKLNVLIKT